MRILRLLWIIFITAFLTSLILNLAIAFLYSCAQAKGYFQVP